MHSTLNTPVPEQTITPSPADMPAIRVEDAYRFFFERTLDMLCIDRDEIIFNGVVLDITDRKQAEEAMRQSQVQQEIIVAQQATLEELSTRLIPISDTVMVMPLIGSMDSQRAQQVLDTLLRGVATAQAEIAIIDITGVSIVDTQVANALIRAAQAVKLLGAQVMLTGIRSEVAQTLVGLGAELPIVTRSTLQSGIEYAMRRR
jgi:rsbT co-antagonist protein RsbR